MYNKLTKLFILFSISMMCYKETSAICCYPHTPSDWPDWQPCPDRICDDGTSIGAFGCCATGACNMFCCNCAGQCREGPYIETFKFMNSDIEYYINDLSEIYVNQSFINRPFYKQENFIPLKSIVINANDYVLRDNAFRLHNHIIKERFFEHHNQISDDIQNNKNNKN